ncbi:hypothetical protein IAU59_007566 [Kwoniella sp. CBS 9459]
MEMDIDTPSAEISQTDPTQRALPYPLNHPYLFEYPPDHPYRQFGQARLLRYKSFLEVPPHARPTNVAKLWNVTVIFPSEFEQRLGRSLSGREVNAPHFAISPDGHQAAAINWSLDPSNGDIVLTTCLSCFGTSRECGLNNFRVIRSAQVVEPCANLRSDETLSLSDQALRIKYLERKVHKLQTLNGKISAELEAIRYRDKDKYFSKAGPK